MKKLLRSIIGDQALLQARDLKARLFPTPQERQQQLVDIEETKARVAFYSQFVQPGSTVFDVGANNGNRIAPLLQLGANIVAVEPQKSCCAVLKHKFGNQIRIVNKGAGESECVKNFHISSTDVLSTFSDEWISSMSESHRFEGYEWKETVAMPITTLDKLIVQYGVPHFIKIDVEGYELEVLGGLSQPIGMISFEYALPEQTGKIIACLERIEQNSPGIECNHCVMEDMAFALPGWLPVADMKSLIRSEKFQATDWGDIYVRMKP